MMMLFLLPLAFFLFAFAPSDFGSNVEDMYRDYAAQMPRGNKVYVCTRDCMGDPKWYRYSAKDLSALKELMQSNSAQGERDNLGRSVQMMKHRLKLDSNSCTGQALNITSHILVLHRNGLLKYHRPHQVQGKICPPWPHYAAQIRANDGPGTVWAVDAYLDKTRTLVQPFSKWYCR